MNFDIDTNDSFYLRSTTQTRTMQTVFLRVATKFSEIECKKVQIVFREGKIEGIPQQF